ncbi:RloB family protein [Streptomyces sp. NPDC051104]|uniref:RloB family protein n=1 Tax=Streptomyces sp. NPDC051104 TaxID=3155044 RepID=UPI003442EE08
MSRRQVRGSQKISKSRNKRTENRRILIVAEGVKTEPQYFESLAAHLNAQAVQVVSVKPVGIGRDPLRVVQEAESRRLKEMRDGDPYDSVWCVVDVDEHATLPQACRLAAKSNLGLAVSNPCFEVWLVWHFEERTAWSTASDLSERLKKFGVLGKSLPPDFPYDRVGYAKVRAGKCAEIKDQHNPPNPSSSVVRLVEELETACMGKQAK